MKQSGLAIILITGLILSTAGGGFLFSDNYSSVAGGAMLAIGAIMVYSSSSRLNKGGQKQKGPQPKGKVDQQKAGALAEAIKTEGVTPALTDYTGDETDPEIRNETVAFALKKVMADFLEDHLLSEEEEQRIEQFVEANNLDVNDINQYGAFWDMAKASVLRKITSGHLPEEHEIPEFTMPLHFNFQKSEQMIWAFSNVDYYKEVKRKRYVGGSQGFSVRVARGVYYRAGAFKGRPVTEKNMEYQDRGIVVLTTKHLYFGSYENMFRIRYNKIVAFTPYEDGIGVMKDTQSAKPLVFKNGDGWFIYNLITNLAEQLEQQP